MKCQLLLLGILINGNFPRNYPILYNIVDGSIATYGCFWSDFYISSELCWIRLFNQYHGLNYKAVWEESANDIFNNEEYKNMDIFPNNNSVKKINDIIVVKLSY